jgi:secondary thiamine-phosphate synthase enzyme
LHRTELSVSTRGDGDVVDLSAEVARVVRESGVARGVVNVFVVGSTAAITTMEHERGGVADLQALLDRIVPREGDYLHNRLNYDTNSHAHQRASLIGASETIPVEAGRVATGTWQQIVLLDFDDRPRERTVVVTVAG